MSIFWNDPNWQHALGALFVEIVFCLALILLVRVLFGRLLGPVGCRLLWGVLIVRCLIPVSIPSLYHPVTHLINAYEQRRENSSEDKAVSPKPPQTNAVETNANESDATIVVNEPIEMSMFEQSGGGHGMSDLPDATPLEIGFGVNPDAAVDADANVLSFNLGSQEGRAVSPRPMQADLIVEQTLPLPINHAEPMIVADQSCRTHDRCRCRRTG